MLSILNELTLQKEMQKFLSNNGQNTTTKQRKTKDNSPCQSRKSNQGPLVPQNLGRFTFAKIHMPDRKDEITFNQS